MPPAMANTVTSLQREDTPDEVRTKFYDILGIDERGAETLGRPVKVLTSLDSDSCKLAHPIVEGIVTLEESLKYDKKEDRLYSPKRSLTFVKKPDDGSDKKRRKQISFVETVSVIPIPARNEYSSRVRQRLWSNATEIQQNARRNAVEFISEGWNWRNVVEDETMHLCRISGELIHPIHYANVGIAPGELLP